MRLGYHIQFTLHKWPNSTEESVSIEIDDFNPQTESPKNLTDKIEKKIQSRLREKGHQITINNIDLLYQLNG